MAHTLAIIVALACCLVAAASARPQQTEAAHAAHVCQGPEPGSELFELPAEDRELRDYVQGHIKSEFTKLENIDEANRFFDRLRLLFRRNLIKTAYARNDMHELHEFLGQESTVQLVRFDNRPFVEPITDDKLDKLQVYSQESELARKIYAKFIRKLIDVRTEQAAKKARGSDGAGVAREPPSFWANVWCKIANNCN